MNTGTKKGILSKSIGKKKSLYDDNIAA